MTNDICRMYDSRTIGFGGTHVKLIQLESGAVQLTTTVFDDGGKTHSQVVHLSHDSMSHLADWAQNAEQ